MDLFAVGGWKRAWGIVWGEASVC